MEISDTVRCLFSAQVEKRDGSYVVEIPEQELRSGSVRQDGTYRVAVMPTPSESETSETSETSQTSETDEEERAERAAERRPQTPPVSEGERRDVEIEDIGDQGDGITRVERGFVVIVPDTREGERVTIEVTDVQENVAFADVIERRSYYE